MADKTDQQLLQDIFTYHQPGANDLERYAAIRNAGFNFAEIIMEKCPPSADRSAAIRAVREATLWANSSVALKGAV